MNEEFKYIPYDMQDENLRGLVKNGNIYNMKRGLSGIILPNDRDLDMEEALRDMEYMKDMYPNETKKYARMVEEECDKLEYEGSPMLAEYPDKEQIKKIAKNVFEKIELEGELDIAAGYMPGLGGRPPRPEQRYDGRKSSHREPPYDGGRPPRPEPREIPRNRGCSNCALRNIIELLVCNEFYCRRDRYRRRRRRFY